MLGCACRSEWRFGGLELDDKNHDWAAKNVRLNDYQSRIRLQKATRDDPILNINKLGIRHADFTICNPPFYSSEAELSESAASKTAPPSAVCTGAVVEMVTENGELGFVTKMVQESKHLGVRIQWYTSMLGKLSTLASIVASIKQSGCTNWAITDLQAGHKTKRWIIAWSFEDLRPQMSRPSSIAKELLPFPAEFSIRGHLLTNEMLGAHLDLILKPLDLQWSWQVPHQVGICLAKQNVWSRAARRKRKHAIPKTSVLQGGKMSLDAEDEDEIIVLAVRISLGDDTGVVNMRWLCGKESVLYESFCGMLKRELVAATSKEVIAMPDGPAKAT